MKNSKITYVSFEPLREGHASYTHVTEVAQGLERLGWSVSLMAPSYKIKNLPSVLQRIWAFLKLWVSVFLTAKPDIFYSRMHFAGSIISVIAKWRKCPVIVEVNGPFEDLYTAWPGARRIKFLFNNMMRYQLKTATGVVCVTPALVKYCQNILGPDADKIRFQVITNGAATDHFKPSSRQSRYLAEKIGSPFAVFFGTFARWQGIDLLLDAASHANWPSPLDLVIIGDGVMKPNVEKAAAENSHIHYIGRIPYHEMPAVISSAKMAFVLTQNIDNRGQYGAYPLKMLEALACGVPVIATELDGQSDVINTHQCGIVLTENSVSAIQKAVTIMLEDTTHYQEMSQNGIRGIAENYSWQAISEKTDSFIRSFR